MPSTLRLLLLIAFFAIPTVGCGPSSAELERERVARQQAENARIGAEQKAESERQRREQESQKHDSEKSQLWMYVFAIGVIAVILLFFGTAIGSSARKDAERNIASDDKRTENSG